MNRDRRRLKVTTLTAILAVGISASWGAAAEETILSVGVGLRSDDLQWSIAGTPAGTSPNILSELTWRDIDMLQLELSAEGEVANNWIIGADLAYGVAFDGEVQDSDYLDDNRTMEYSRSFSDSSRSHATDYGVRVGYAIRMGDDSGFTITPMLGISHKELKMKMRGSMESESLILISSLQDQ